MVCLSAPQPDLESAEKGEIPLGTSGRGRRKQEQFWKDSILGFFFSPDLETRREDPSEFLRFGMLKSDLARLIPKKTSPFSINTASPWAVA